MLEDVITHQSMFIYEYCNAIYEVFLLLNNLKKKKLLTAPLIARTHQSHSTNEKGSAVRKNVKTHLN